MSKDDDVSLESAAQSDKLMLPAPRRSTLDSPAVSLLNPELMQDVSVTERKASTAGGNYPRFCAESTHGSGRSTEYANERTDTDSQRNQEKNLPTEGNWFSWRDAGC